MSKPVCPYCFETFPPARITYRCINPSCEPENDLPLSTYRRSPSPLRLPRVVPATSARANSATCSCGTTTNKIICNQCHNDLPGQFGQTESYTIALIGSKESGKSNYIAVLLHELANRVGQSFNAALSALDEQTIKRYKEDFGGHLYERHQVVPTTVPARVQASVRNPLVYRLSLSAKRLFLFDGVRAVTLVFFDTAGEDLNNIDIMSTEAKYIANSDALVFLLDPLQIPSVRDRLQNAISLPRENAAPTDIISRVTLLIRQRKAMRPAAKIKTPVALAFSKIDAVRSIVDRGSPIERTSNHDGFLDLTDVEEMNDTMRAYVRDQWVGPNFDRFLIHNFEKFRFFGISALGSSPDNGMLPRGVAPFRVEDPLLWLLYEMGVISGRKRRRA